MADRRSVEQAAEVAAQFVNRHQQLRARRQSPATAGDMRLAYTGTVKGQTAPAYYVFNQSEKQGAVFVSADTRALPVLGYTDKGGFDYASANPSLRWWLGRYERQLAAASAASEAMTPAAAQEYVPVAPLLGKIEYDQEKPYSNLCPLDGTQRSLTGCVATATAQVMRMWRYPSQGTGSHSYTSNQLKKTVSADFNVPYDWDNMLESYSGSYNTAQAKAVATLMFHCGVACDMDYSYDEGSGAFTDDMAAGLVNYFGYNVDRFATQLSQRDYGAAHFSPAEYSVKTPQMLSYIYDDLEQGRPVILGGNDTYGEGGHEFVCDGRDSSGKLHINWGWSGDGNGYFAITALDYQGYEFSSDLDAVFGLEPAQKEYIPVESLSVTPVSLTLRINERQTLTATVLPVNSSVRIASWTSSDPAVATVSGGAVKGVSPGTAVITATADGQQAEAVVTVTEESVPSRDFILVTDAEALGVGEEILIVNEDNEVALGVTQNKNNRSEASVTISGNSITIEDENTTDVQILTLTQGASDGTFGLYAKDGYLYAASSSKNYLRTQSPLTGDASWTISIDNGKAQITAQGNNSHNTISYSSMTRVFSAYQKQQKPVAVYARQKPTGLPAVRDDVDKPRKIIRDGQLVIILDNKEYNAQGVRVR